MEHLIELCKTGHQELDYLGDYKSWLIDQSRWQKLKSKYDNRNKKGMVSVMLRKDDDTTIDTFFTDDLTIYKEAG
ncbi:MAG TPA: hypothetical protein DDY13_02240 [Cytophagales bacterium]|jgi:hypothetical protein|nr:hypothetical protein [Cytophagales bacterium]